MSLVSPYFEAMNYAMTFEIYLNYFTLSIGISYGNASSFFLY